MRIWFQKHAVTNRVRLLDELYANHVTNVADPATLVDFHGLPESTYDNSLPDELVALGGVEDLFGSFFAAQAVRAATAGYDAFVIGTCPDPGLVTARSLVEIPVVGYGEISMHMAAMCASHFGVIGFIPQLEDRIRQNAFDYGLERRLATFAYTSAGPDEAYEALEGRPGPFLDSLRAAARRAIAAGAEILICSEGVPNEILVSEEVWAVDDVPIIDSDGLAIRFAEFLVALRRDNIMPAVRTGYRGRRPTPDQLAHLMTLFAPAARK